VVSDLTLATYSEEKAEYIKREFFRRIKEEMENNDGKEPSLEERHALLRELQAEVETRFKKAMAHGEEGEEDEGGSLGGGDDLDKLIGIIKFKFQERTSGKCGRSAGPVEPMQRSHETGRSNSGRRRAATTTAGSASRSVRRARRSVATRSVPPSRRRIFNPAGELATE